MRLAAGRGHRGALGAAFAEHTRQLGDDHRHGLIAGERPVGKFVPIALVLAASSAEAAPSCAVRADAASCLTTLAAASSIKNAPKVADILCCCKTASGGE